MFILRQTQTSLMNCAEYVVTIIHPVKQEKLSGLIVMSVINGTMKFVHLRVRGKIFEKVVGCVIKINNLVLLKKNHMRKVITILNITWIIFLFQFMLKVNSGPAKYLSKN